MSDKQQSQPLATTVQERTAPEGNLSWPQYWSAQGMPWRTEPEIVDERQRFLAERRAIQPDIEKDMYPFKEIRLDRADVEWLLATHESGGMHGPVDWGDKQQRERVGLDLRGAWLQQTDLSGLPLARLVGGLRSTIRETATSAQRVAAAIHLERANFRDTHLEDAVLSDAHLEGAALGGTFGHRTHLELAKLIEAHLEGADCSYARLDGAAMFGVYLEGATLLRAHLIRSELREAKLGGANLTRTHLEGAWLDYASFAGKAMTIADMGRIPASRTPFAREIIPADLREALFDTETSLKGITLGDQESGYVFLADVRWNNVNLAVVDWTRTRRGFLRQRVEVIELGDERTARQAKDDNGTPKDKARRLQEYKDAVRANRQLATILRGQGLNEDADRFAYKAQKLQRQVLRRQGRWGAALGSWFLDLIAGYGYRPLRSLFTYILIICSFAGAYLLNAQLVAPHLTWDEALVLSISSFHGRGFFSQGITLGDTYARIAAGEALSGLLIEITFIATFTQRFFAR